MTLFRSVYIPPICSAEASSVESPLRGPMANNCAGSGALLLKVTSLSSSFFRAGHVLKFGNIITVKQNPYPHPLPPPPPPSPPPFNRQGFNQESLEDARVQLRAVLPLLLGRVARVSLAALDDGIDAWLSAALVDYPTQQPPPGLDNAVGGGGVGVGDGGDVGGGGGDGGGGGTGDGSGDGSDCSCSPRLSSSPPLPGPPPPPTPPSSPLSSSGTGRVTRGGTSTLLPSVRCGIEMALIHLLARTSGMSIGGALSAASGLPCRGTIEINGLSARGEGSRRSEVRQTVFAAFRCRGWLVPSEEKGSVRSGGKLLELTTFLCRAFFLILFLIIAVTLQLNPQEGLPSATFWTRPWSQVSSLLPSGTWLRFNRA